MSLNELGSGGSPLRVAIVGSGPSGFYAVQELLKSDLTVEVDMFDRLATPYGLVRHGVAPDHQKIKNSIAIFDRIARKDGFSFWGNVTVGRDLSVEELEGSYHAIVFAYGAESDRHLNIPGEDLPGSYTATAFVGWYNGHPDYRDHEFDLSHETAAVIGQGNVAADVCRVLMKTVDELKHTDIAAHALEALAESKVRRVHMIGRRGPVQAKISQGEIKELGEMAECDAIVSPESMEFDAISQAEFDADDGGNASRVVPVLLDYSQRPAPTKARRLYIDFFQSPKEVLGSAHVEGIVLERNVLAGDATATWAEGTGETEELACGLVFRSVGYRGLSMPGVPLDEKRGVIENVGGRVMEDGHPKRGQYVAGWIKRGPSGVIGTNKPDSRETVRALLEDIGSLSTDLAGNSGDINDLLVGRGVHRVSFEDWARIDAEEVFRGEAVGKPREKFTRTTEVLSFLAGGRSEK